MKCSKFVWKLELQGNISSFPGNIRLFFASKSARAPHRAAENRHASARPFITSSHGVSRRLDNDIPAGTFRQRQVLSRPFEQEAAVRFRLFRRYARQAESA